MPGALRDASSGSRQPGEPPRFSTQSRNELPLTIAENGCARVLIFRPSNALAYFLLPKPPSSSRPPGPTCGACWPASGSTGSSSDPSGPSSPTTSRLSSAQGGPRDVHARSPRYCRTQLQRSPASGLTPEPTDCCGGAVAALAENDRPQPWQVQRPGP